MDNRGFTVIPEFRNESFNHPIKNINLECEFASELIYRHDPCRILDVGSYRLWLIGVMSSRQVVTVDVRPRRSELSNENIIIADIAHDVLDRTNLFDMVVSLSTIEHVGLGRYADKFDPEGDLKAVDNMLKALRPGGHFIFTVPVTAGTPCVVHNSHRIYCVDMIRENLKNLDLIEERFIKMESGNFHFCLESELVREIGKLDIYCGCYRKKLIDSDD